MLGLKDFQWSAQLKINLRSLFSFLAVSPSLLTTEKMDASKNWSQNKMSKSILILWNGFNNQNIAQGQMQKFGKVGKDAGL